MAFKRTVDIFKQYITLPFKAILNILDDIPDIEAGFIRHSCDCTRALKIKHQLIFITMSVLVGRMVAKCLPCSFLIQFKPNRITRAMNQAVYLRILCVIERIRCYIVPTLAFQCINDLKNPLFISSLIASERNQFLKIGQISTFVFLHGAFLLTCPIARTGSETM